MAFADLLVQRAALERGTVTRDAQGGETVAWARRDSGLPVLVRQARPPRDVRLGTDEAVTHVLYCLPIPELAAEAGPWRFVVEGRTYVVVDAFDPASRRHHLEVRVRRVQ